MQHPDIPRVTYTNLGVDFSTLHALLDKEIPAARSRLGQKMPNIVGDRRDTSGTAFEVRSPIDRSLVIGTCYETPAAVVADAVAAARAAYPAWAATKWQDRLAILEKATRKLADRRFDLGIACLLEVGKSRFEAMGEAEEALDVIPYYIEEMKRNDGYSQPLKSAVPGETGVTVMRPYGVFAVIGPYNFPLSTPINQIASALMTGNTVVYKPSPGSGLTASMIVQCFLEAGVPAGCLNMVCGGDEVGKALIASNIDGAAFTGSANAGHAIRKALTSGDYTRPVIAEMGGKNPAIVSKTADLDAAAEGLVRSAFGLQGEKCSSCEVAYIDETVYDQIVPLIRDKAAKLKVGNPEKVDTFVGPLINEEAGALYEKTAAQAQKDGKVVFGGHRLKGGDYDAGIYVEPLVVGDLPPEHTQVRDELFLPYLALQKFKDLPEALSRANGIRYGLTAGFYGRDEKDLAYFFDNIEAGTVYVNRRSGATTGAWPGIQSFGGWKSSGLTGKNAFGPHYLPLFMREQNRTVMKA